MRKLNNPIKRFKYFDLLTNIRIEIKFIRDIFIEFIAGSRKMSPTSFKFLSLREINR